MSSDNHSEVFNEPPNNSSATKILIKGVPRNITKQILQSCKVHRLPNNNIVTIAEKAYQRKLNSGETSQFDLP